MLRETKTILDLLLEAGKIDQTQYNSLQMQQLRTNRPAEDVVAESGLVPEADITAYLSQLNGIPLVRLKEVGAAPEALSLVDIDIARRYQMFPFAVDNANNTLLVAMDNPLDVAAIQFVSQKTGRRVIPHYANKSDIAKMIEDAYNNNLSAEVNEAIAETENVVKAKSVESFSELTSEGIIRQAPIAKIVEQILGFAVGSGASDIHIEPQANRIRVRYRIDGLLMEKLILPRSVLDSLVSRIKILSRLKIDEKRVPQDGRFGFSSDKGSVDLRVSTLPTVLGEKIVIRLLRKQERIPTMEELGMAGRGLQKFNEALHVPQGIILVTGPTGSGKTTTLYSALHIVNTVSVNVLTVEDPVEFEMQGVSQVQVNNQAGLTFAAALRSFLRQDPDVIMVGEIRDQETAALAVQASLTGHKVFSTLHTNSAAGAIPRLFDMGIEPFLLSSSITLVMAQRVARRLNPQMSEEYVPTSEEVTKLQEVLGRHFDEWLQQNNKTVDTLRLRRPRSDLANKEDGYKGRVAIFEIMPMSPALQELTIKNAPAIELEKVALAEGMLLMKQDGFVRVLEGMTTMEEILRVAET
ncbi:Flp pilus assembly complex ATPase component TadA [bacterium]|nr:Flp pilus assembly complex ATPase component TadA [bacterium]